MTVDPTFATAQLGQPEPPVTRDLKSQVSGGGPVNATVRLTCIMEHNMKSNIVSLLLFFLSATIFFHSNGIRELHAQELDPFPATPATVEFRYSCAFVNDGDEELPENCFCGESIGSTGQIFDVVGYLENDVPEIVSPTELTDDLY